MIKQIFTLAIAAMSVMTAWGTKYTPCDEHKYPSTMTVTAQAWFNDAPVACEIAAFAPDGECRGVAVTEGDDNLAFITIQGDSEPVTLSFRIVHEAYGEQEDVLVDETMPFVSNDMVGTPSDPFKFNFGWCIIDGVAYNEIEDHADVVVTYKRHFLVDTWQALFIPVDLSVTALVEFGQIAKLQGITTIDGKQSLSWQYVTDANIQPGVPYLFKPFPGVTDILITEAGRTLKSANEKTDEVVEFNGVQYVVRGTYVEKNDMATCEAYALVNGVFKQAINDDAILRPHRIYLNIINPTNGTNPETLENIVGSDIGHGGVYDIVTPVDTDAPIYDLQGRRVDNPKHGFYIQSNRIIKF